MTTANNPIDELLPFIHHAVETWRTNNTGEKIAQRVTTELDAQAKSVMLKLLGFEASNWSNDSWTIDNCNGRASTTAVGKFIAEHQTAAIQEWLTTVAMPSLSPKELTAIKKSTDQAYKQQLIYAIQQEVSRVATRDAKLLVEGVSQSTQIDSYLKTMKLIGAEPPIE